MRLAGLMLLCAGWFLVVASLRMLPAGALRGSFLAVSFAVQVLGLVLALRAFGQTAASRQMARRGRS